jgi:hypothetical protein
MSSRLAVLTSPDAIAPDGVVDQEMVDVLSSIQGQGNPVGIVSNRTRPAWFESRFGGTKVVFAQVQGRQDGKVIPHNAQRLKLQPHDFLVLAANREDVAMGKNGGGVLVAAPASQVPEVLGLGINLRRAQDLEDVVRLSRSWPGDWWFRLDSPQYRIRVLTDLSSKGAQVDAQIAFSKKVVAVVKNGGPALLALLTVTVRSLLKEGVASLRELMWGVFPSSASNNQDEEVLSDFTHRLRTTASKVRFAMRGQPLFIRHAHSVKRSSSAVNRMDPSNQIETLHLNPFYDGKVQGRHVVMVDDCTTYGASIGVAAAFLRKAGASAVTALALGKFGNQFHTFDITIASSPFSPVARGRYAVRSAAVTQGTTNVVAQAALREMLD